MEGYEGICAHPSDPAIPFDRAINDDRRIYCSWLDWCIASLKGQPEYYYLIQALTEKLESDASLSEPPNAELYRYLLLHKETNAVPVLVKRYDTYNKHEDNGGEAFAGAREITYRGMFEPILEIADSRHANLLEKFITEKPVGAAEGETRRSPQALCTTTSCRAPVSIESPASQVVTVFGPAWNRRRKA